MSAHERVVDDGPGTLAVIESSTRPGRVGPVIAEWIVGRAGVVGWSTVDLIDLAAVDLPFLDEPEPAASGQYRHEHTRLWSARIVAADALVIVTPEYNGSFPAPLKNALDFLYCEWSGKRVGLVGYGFGSGGAHSVGMLEHVVRALRMAPSPVPVMVDLRRHVTSTGMHSDRQLDASADDLLAYLAASTVGGFATSSAQ